VVQTADLQATILKVESEFLLTRYSDILDTFNAKIAPEKQLALATLVANKHPQQLLTGAVYAGSPERIGMTMRAHGRIHEARTFKACYLEAYSGEFLKALPIPGLNLVMSNTDFRLSLRSYFGMPIFQQASNCSVCHRQANDTLGLHASKCRSTHRHERVKQLVKALATEAGLTAEMETPNLLPNSEDRLADVLIRAFEGGRDLAIDVNITETRGSDEDPVSQLQKAVDRKNRHYLARCEAVNLDFVPFVADSVGGIHPEAERVIDRLAIFYARRRDCTVACAKSRLMQRIYFCIKRAMAAEYSLRRLELEALDAISVDDGSAVVAT